MLSVKLCEAGDLWILKGVILWKEIGDTRDTHTFENLPKTQSSVLIISWYGANDKLHFPSGERGGGGGVAREVGRI